MFFIVVHVCNDRTRPILNLRLRPDLQSFAQGSKPPEAGRDARPTGMPRVIPSGAGLRACRLQAKNRLFGQPSVTLPSLRPVLSSGGELRQMRGSRNDAGLVNGWVFREC